MNAITEYYKTDLAGEAREASPRHKPAIDWFVIRRTPIVDPYRP